MYSKSIQKMIDLFSKFPTVGPRTAGRFVFYLLQEQPEKIQELIQSIQELKNNVKVCLSCFNSFESDNDLCNICGNKTRDKSLLCIVANEIDLKTIEKTNKYKGFYFVLGGTFSALKKSDIEKLRTKELVEKISKLDSSASASELKNNPEINEIILALNPTTEGESTILYLERLLRPFGKKISRLGRGLPLGAELEYADDETLSAAFENRK